MKPSADEVLHDQVYLTVDVEWANPEVLADLLRLLDERELRATFFCTHVGVHVPGHERALHPNLRRNGDTLRRLRESVGPGWNSWTDAAIYRHVVQATHAFCPEAVGVRGHSLFYDSELLRMYREAGLEYDSTYFLPLTPGLSPVWKVYGMLEMPMYYVDQFDLIEQATEFRLTGLHLDRPGMKVLAFHPNMVFINASTNAQYLASKPCYQDPERLLRLRHPGRGVRTLFLELMDFLATRPLSVATLGDLNTAWRAASKPSRVAGWQRRTPDSRAT
jgi:hypothetical protein